MRGVSRLLSLPNEFRKAGVKSGVSPLRCNDRGIIHELPEIELVDAFVEIIDDIPLRAGAIEGISCTGIRENIGDLTIECRLDNVLTDTAGDIERRKQRGIGETGTRHVQVRGRNGRKSAQKGPRA